MDAKASLNADHSLVTLKILPDNKSSQISHTGFYKCNTSAAKASVIDAKATPEDDTDCLIIKRDIALLESTREPTQESTKESLHNSRVESSHNSHVESSHNSHVESSHNSHVESSQNSHVESLKNSYMKTHMEYHLESSFQSDRDGAQSSILYVNVKVDPEDDDELGLNDTNSNEAENFV